ncbi:unnamed protein product [Onchocerca flexuosa]|uniref:Ovule protein n=1 Tax=Onchocerca flexuosa TaxID=387005 RepID=A0A183HQN0_9BILA|nr:unnamed protein product [Onchocerca flexuosa]
MSSTENGSVEAGDTYTYRYYFCKYLTPIRTAIGLLTVLGHISIQFRISSSQHVLLLTMIRLHESDVEVLLDDLF